MRLADHPGMQAEAKHPAAFIVQGVEGLVDDVGITAHRNPPQPQQLHVVPLRLRRQRDQRPAHVQRVRLVVVRPVRDIVEAGFGQQARRALRLTVILAQPAARPGAGGALQRVERGADEHPLLVFRHVAGEHACGVAAVTDEFVAARAALTKQLRVAPGGGTVECHRCPDAVLVKGLKDTENADAIAVLALPPGAVVRIEAAVVAQKTRIAVRIRGWLQLPVFDVQHHAESEAGTVWPGERRAAAMASRRSAGGPCAMAISAIHRTGQAYMTARSVWRRLRVYGRTCAGQRPASTAVVQAALAATSALSSS